jgi:type IV secretion system protein VirB3/type IV secretion system protein VirB4
MTNNENIRNSVPFHQSLIKPVLYAGAERELTIMLAFSALIIWIVGKDLVSIIAAGLFWLIGIFLAQMAAFIDPQLTRIFIRHLRYQDHYPATERLESAVRHK